MTPEYLQSLLQRYQIKPNKVLGQNFLMDETVMEDMLDSAGVEKGDTIVEVGPGIGVFTGRMLERGANVLAIEKDAVFLPRLKASAKEHKNLWYEIGDALKFDFSKALTNMPLPYKVIANIPYYITGKLIQQFVNLKPKPESITLLIQKEVARNIVAEPGKLGLLAISVQIHGNPKIIRDVPAQLFYPQPKVDSSVIHVSIPEHPPYKIADEKLFFQVLRACFAGKRKQIHNTLENNLHLKPEVVSNLLKKLHIDPTARPQALSIPQWISLVVSLRDISK